MSDDLTDDEFGDWIKKPNGHEASASGTSDAVVGTRADRRAGDGTDGSRGADDIVMP